MKVFGLFKLKKKIRIRIGPIKEIRVDCSNLKKKKTKIKINLIKKQGRLLKLKKKKIRIKVGQIKKIRVSLLKFFKRNLKLRVGLDLS